MTYSASLVTCARVPESELKGEYISLISEPTPGNPQSRSSIVLVSDYSWPT